MPDDRQNVTKLRKIQTSADFSNWRQLLYAYIRRDDYALVRLSELQDNADESLRTKWNTSNVKEKYSIILTLGDRPLAQRSKTIDENKRSYKELWD